MYGISRNSGVSLIRIFHLQCNKRYCCLDGRDTSTGRNWLKLNSQVKNVHTTSTRKALPPVISLLIRPLLQGASFLAGRSFKRWWRALPEERRDAYWQRAKEKRSYILGGSATLASLGWLYYMTGLEETPITKRKRFVTFSDKQIQELSQLEFKSVCSQFLSRILDPGHPSYCFVTSVVNRLLRANRELPEIYTKNWTITVIDEPGQRNAFVLPNGNIFVFTGMLSICTADELGAVLGHEIAHALLGHGKEKATRDDLLGWLQVAFTGIVWAIFPTDLTSYIAYSLGWQTTVLGLDLPYSRMLECEADHIGLELAARACFDVRAASSFWTKMGALSEAEDEIDIEWLSTHPSNESRQKTIDDLMNSAIQVRNECQCPRLPDIDPRHLVDSFKKAFADQISANDAKPIALLIKAPDMAETVKKL